MKILIIIMLVVLVGCEKGKGEYTGRLTSSLSMTKEICINDVVYYDVGYGIAPAFKADGSLYTCNGNKK